jgi:hypothetical protein
MYMCTCVVILKTLMEGWCCFQEESLLQIIQIIQEAIHELNAHCMYMHINVRVFILIISSILSLVTLVKIFIEEPQGLEQSTRGHTYKV